MKYYLMVFVRKSTGSQVVVLKSSADGTWWPTENAWAEESGWELLTTHEIPESKLRATQAQIDNIK